MLLINEEQVTAEQLQILENHAKKILGKMRWPVSNVTFHVGQNYRTVDSSGKKRISKKVNIRVFTRVNIPELKMGTVQLRYAENVNPQVVQGAVIKNYLPTRIEIDNGQKAIHAQRDREFLIFMILHEGYGLHRKFYIPDTLGEAQKKTAEYQIQNQFDNLVLNGLSVEDMRTLLSKVPGHELMQRDELVQQIRSIYGAQPKRLISMVEEGKLDSLTYVQKGFLTGFLEFNSKTKSFKFSDSDEILFEAKGSKAKDEFVEFLKKPQHENVYRELKRSVIAYEKGVEKSALEENEEMLSEQETSNPFEGMKEIDIPKDKKMWDGWSQEVADEIREEAKSYGIKSAHIKRIETVIQEVAEYKSETPD